MLTQETNMFTFFASHLQWFLAELSVSEWLEKIAFGGNSAAGRVSLVEASEIVVVYT